MITFHSVLPLYKKYNNFPSGCSKKFIRPEKKAFVIWVYGYCNELYFI